MDSNTITAEELSLLIDQTYKIENDFKDLKASYGHLQRTIEEVVEFLPNAIWIVQSDNSIFLQNSQAKNLSELFLVLHLDQDDYEITFDERSYLIKTSTYQDKHLISATDITEQKRKENLATMGQMAAHLSHEIRNPIGSIALLTSMLKKRVLPRNVAVVEEVEKSIFRIERIIKSTLMFSKGVHANPKLLQWKQIEEALENTIAYYSFEKEIDFRLIKENFSLQGDLELLIMLFSNFLINAIDAIELDEDQTGMVEMHHEQKDGIHHFLVYDSGVAIADKSKLFEAFASTKVKGNGLGLILAKQIAQAHGGDVRLLEGESKIFEITLADTIK
jgi:two-component system, NtrC family, sensor kinase